MSDQSITVPLEIPAPTQEQPVWARRSLHNVKMGSTIARQAKTAPQFEENRYSGTPEVRWRPVEESTEPEAPTLQQTQPYQVNMENQYDGQQPQQQQQSQQATAAQPPDPMSYDFYDSNDVARFHQDNGAYYQQLVDARVQAHLAPHASALQEAQLRQDYNAAVERYGNDGNFQEVMDVALKNCAEAQARGKQFSIVAEYQKANDASAARPGQRGNAHLPEAFRDKRRGIGMLGRIMHHNQQTGRSGRR